jgi:RNA polymerase sigma-70 factor, ECF subfamily
LEKEFIQIISRHQGIIHKVCRLYCNTTDDAEDLFQEIVLQLWLSYPSFNHYSIVSTWMYKVGLNTAITKLRKQNGRKNIESLSIRQYNLAEDEGNLPVIEKEDALWKAINQLNKFDKAIVLLYLEDKTYREMAEIIGISESNVAVKINRIKKRLKELMNPY